MVDISKNTVLILLVLVIVSTVITTWAIITSINAAPRAIVSTPKTTVGSGELSLEITEPKESSSNAQVVLDIQEQAKGGK
jgi:hypothetical protein